MIPNIQPVSRAAECSLCDLKVEAGGGAAASLRKASAGYSERLEVLASSIVICSACAREVAMANDLLVFNLEETRAARDLVLRLPLEEALGAIRNNRDTVMSTCIQERYDLQFTGEEMRDARCDSLDFAIGVLESLLRDLCEKETP